MLDFGKTVQLKWILSSSYYVQLKMFCQSNPVYFILIKNAQSCTHDKYALLQYIKWLTETLAFSTEDHFNQHKQINGLRRN